MQYTIRKSLGYDDGTEQFSEPVVIDFSSIRMGNPAIFSTRDGWRYTLSNVENIIEVNSIGIRFTTKEGFFIIDFGKYDK